MNQHEIVCGSRTELCHKCRKYVLNKDKLLHEISGCLVNEKSPRKTSGRRQELFPTRRPDSSLNVFPCEFCFKQFIGFQQLIEHQVFDFFKLLKIESNIFKGIL